MRPGTPGHLALTLGRPIHLTFDQEMVDRIAIPGTEDYRRHFGIRSGLAVPLVAGGEFHGVVHFGLGPSGRTYTDVDARTAGELGSRIASAIANARAYARQRTAAVTLQRSVLPGDVPPVEGLDVAWRYEPGTAGTEVGGDWFDVIPLSAGRVALVIGDVMGRGLTAAAAMGQVRAAVRAFAALDLTAADVLTNLDDLVRAIGTGPDGTLVSAIYAIWEPATASITVANAGHLPPAHARPRRPGPLPRRRWGHPRRHSRRRPPDRHRNPLPLSRGLHPRPVHRRTRRIRHHRHRRRNRTPPTRPRPPRHAPRHR